MPRRQVFQSGQCYSLVGDCNCECVIIFGIVTLIVVVAGEQNAAGKYLPVELPEYHAAPCPYCPKDLSFAPRKQGVPCPTCGAIPMRLMEVPPELLEVPDITFVRCSSPLLHTVAYSRSLLLCCCAATHGRTLTCVADRASNGNRACLSVGRHLDWVDRRTWRRLWAGQSHPLAQRTWSVS